MNKSYAFLIILLLFINCRKNDSSKSEFANSTFMEMILKDANEQIKIPLDSTSTFYAENIQYSHNENFELLITMHSNTINIYDIVKGEQINKISLSREGPNSIQGEAGGFYYQNKDSIFVLSKFTFKVFLMNSKGQIRNSYQVLENMKPEIPGPNGSSFTPLTFTNNALYLSGVYPREKKRYKYHNAFIKYDLKTKNISFPGKAVSRLGLGNWELAAKLYYSKVSNNDFVLSSSISDSVVLLSNGTPKDFLASSSFFNESDIQPFSTSFKKASDYLERAKYIVEMPVYEGVLYDKYRKVYYRIGKLKNSSFEEFMSGKLPEKVVSIFDENFRKIGDQKLPKYGELNYGMCFISKEGLCIANKTEYSENDSFLIFDIFELHEK